MAYSEKVIDHYQNPKNVGTLDKSKSNVGTGLVGAPECFVGDTLIAIPEYPGLKGKTIEDAVNIDNMSIVEELNLPPVKIHCSVLAEDAIKAAIDDYLKKNNLPGIVWTDY